MTAPRKAIATAAGLVALLIERDSIEGDAVWAVLGAVGLYIVCHTATDVVGIIWGRRDGKDE